MKKILLLMLMVVYAFSIQRSFLEPHEAFQVKLEEQQDKIVASIKLGKDIYLYDEQLKVFITKPEKKEITSKLQMPKPEPYDEFIVHFNEISIDIPFSLLKEELKADSYEVQLLFQGCSKAGLCYAPMSETISVNLASNLDASKIIETKKDVTINETIANENISESDSIVNTLKDKSAILVLATFFGFGLLLSLTPCVFPMIPILSSIIVKAGDNEKLTASKGFFLSLVYVLAMALAYTIAGVIAGLFGANLQVALQNPYVLVSFAFIFVVLAFSMFGYFKLELPQSLQTKLNKTTEGKEKQGVFGVAVMGFLSALVVGPCVAPPLAGALVYIGQTGDAILGGAALFVMSLGMGVPLLLIGLGAGKFMPKPGGWMEQVTKVFGIVMLAIAVWMLDRVLDPTLIMYLWALLFLGAGLFIKTFEHVLVKLLATVLLIYGTATFIGAISGATNVLKPLEKFTSSKVVATSSSDVKFVKVKNLEELDQAIKASSKPVMLDFWAEWCVSCKELDNITFQDEEVKKVLERFTILKADVTKNTDEDKALMKKFQVFGPPALIFFDENNQEMKAAKIIGYKNPQEFLEVINKNFK
ncbi:protein-disulfide reductase DsbD [Halarcobacter bivalviorum]|uniref:Thiol:disulfide interchange protein n=2 Tax=Arcobacteraceae TaxID=2808963 RepID=A0AAX2A7S9_9BACT|nr:protein-disulfide reductase DsbD [Halarcobacter bivalviorum]AXH13416.1 thiol:disulfide interchange protein DsbD [Halarcobacter bivalviorum]RXK09984.1 thiol:disulfide interchange protein [Halarcobacter bivalviorum]